MTTTRSYRGARTIEEAIVELRRCAGTQFDPAFVDAMVAAVESTAGTRRRRRCSTRPPTRSSTSRRRRFDHDDPTHADSIARGSRA